MANPVRRPKPLAGLNSILGTYIITRLALTLHFLVFIWSVYIAEVWPHSSSSYLLIDEDACVCWNNGCGLMKMTYGSVSVQVRSLIAFHHDML